MNCVPYYWDLVVDAIVKNSSDSAVSAVVKNSPDSAVDAIVKNSSDSAVGAIVRKVLIRLWAPSWASFVKNSSEKPVKGYSHRP